jgi:hypothetical protein
MARASAVSRVYTVPRGEDYSGGNFGRGDAAAEIVKPVGDHMQLAMTRPQV